VIDFAILKNLLPAAGAAAAARRGEARKRRRLGSLMAVGPALKALLSLQTPVSGSPTGSEPVGTGANSLKADPPQVQTLSRSSSSSDVGSTSGVDSHNELASGLAGGYSLNAGPPVELAAVASLSAPQACAVLSLYGDHPLVAQAACQAMIMAANVQRQAGKSTNVKPNDTAMHIIPAESSPVLEGVALAPLARCLLTYTLRSPHAAIATDAARLVQASFHLKTHSIHG
jgi:hypothetical protein